MSSRVVKGLGEAWPAQRACGSRDSVITESLLVIGGRKLAVGLGTKWTRTSGQTSCKFATQTSLSKFITSGLEAAVAVLSYELHTLPSVRQEFHVFIGILYWGIRFMKPTLQVTI